MNSSYVKNTWADYDKIDDFARDIFSKLSLGSAYDYISWKVEDDKFMIISDCSECQCTSIDWFPVAWLDLPEEELKEKYFAELQKLARKRVIGHE